MWLVLSALRRPVTVLVAVLAVLLGSYLAVTRMKKDIFPQVGSPTIYVAQPYGGMDPSQMEGFLTYYYEYHFLYITGIEHVESKSIQGAALMKLVFHEGTDMNQAMAETVGYVNRSRAFMPPGAVPPFITRFDAGSVPVGQLVFTSPNRTPGEMQDFALNRVRPLFATLPGVSAPPPFGGNQRTIVVRANPDKLREYHLSPEDVVNAVNRASVVLPSGNVRIGDLNRIANTNSVIGGNLQELADAPVRSGNGATVFLRDVAAVENGTDIVSGYAHSNGKRTVYINVTKRSDASTLDVINAVKANLGKFRAVVPEDVKIDLVFDQSGYVTDALRSLISEGLLGALLTGLMVLLFLRDWRSALIVVATIPFALLGAVLGLWAAGQTINIMTLAGLALAVGVLVDEATVEIENIHSHLAAGFARPHAVLDAASKTAVPRLLSMLSILAVFVPAFFMTGVARQLFVPLALAVGFAMIASYILSTTLVPVLSVWVMRHGRGEQEQAFLRRAYTGYLNAVVQLRYLVFLAYAGGVLLLLWLLVPRLGTEFFPTVDSGQFQVRLRAPTGTRVEKTELETLKALDVIRQTVGPDNVAISTAFIGVQPASYPINTVHLWTNGPQEAVLKVALKKGTPVPKEKIRQALQKFLPHLKVSFEAADIISQVMSFGAPTPIEVAVQGPQIATARPHAEKVRAELAKITYLRDLQMAQSLDYPTVDVTVDRERAGQLGLTTQQVTKSLVMATSSSRFTDPNYWRDPMSGNAFQIQVEIPQHRMQSVQELSEVPILNGTQLRDVAQLKLGTAFGSVERYNMQRVVSFTGNVEGHPLGDAEREIRAAIKRAGDPPRGVTVAIRGQIPALDETEAGLRRGLLLSVAVIFLLLAASFQSFRLALATVLIAPAVVCGVAIVLLLAHTTLNIQSFLGAIMAIGIATANSILMISFMEAARRTGLDHRQAAVEGARSRLRAILMTATAMIAGMIPIAVGGAQTAPLGQAVIGGLLFSTIATLTVLPALYAIVQTGAPVQNRSLDPTDPDSRYYEAS